MPPLEGPDRALQWGERCRHQLVTAAYTVLAAEGGMDEAGWADLEERARAVTRAGWWIDQRDAEAGDLPELLAAAPDNDTGTEKAGSVKAVRRLGKPAALRTIDEPPLAWKDHMTPSPSRPPPAPILVPAPDPVTVVRDVTHGHFRPGDEVVILKGVSGDGLWGDPMRVVAPSEHAPTAEAGWRLRDPDGGKQTYVTAHPRYLAHVTGYCPDCLIYLRAMQAHLAPKVPERDVLIDCGWYTTTAGGQIVHRADAEKSS
jgi:hypothetical protein